MVTLFWIVAVILVIVGIWQMIQRNFILGAALIIVGLLIGPGGVSILNM